MSVLDVLPTITEAKFVKCPDENKDVTINAKINGVNAFIPIDDNNRVYQQVLKLVANGTLTIQAS